MKKLSVSLFAVLAIAFAVFSAFNTATPKASKVLVSGYWANQDASTSDFDGINADQSDAADDETETNISSLITGSYTLEDFAGDHCDNNPTTSIVCAVQIANDDVVDVKTGLYF